MTVQWMTELKTVIDLLLVVAPWLIVIILTQFMKMKFYNKLTDWLRVTLCLATPLILASVFFFIFGMPDLNIWVFLQNVIACWLLSIGGFEVTKGVKKIADGLMKKE